MKTPKLELKLGAEPKKVAILGGLLLLAAYLFYANVLSSPEAPAGPAPRPAAKVSGPAVARRTDEVQTLTAPPKDLSAGKAGSREFRPSLKPKKGEDRSTLDPTLRLDLLARLSAVQVERIERSLFDFGSVEAPKPKQPEPKIEVKKPVARMIGPEPPPPPPPPPVKPPPPPITLKFFGNALPAQGGVKRVFCLQGEEILTPAEGEVILRRYKIVRINVNSVLVEDLEYKNQQTVPIEQPPPVA
ncbi:MAG: hypothetical protein HY821_00775 [Acidobacteria bacterium]|nr:hypothetical protein [Acidobacteriota bacterium]